MSDELRKAALGVLAALGDRKFKGGALKQACATLRAALDRKIEISNAREDAMADGAGESPATLAPSPSPRPAEVKPTGEGERCVTCGGAGCMNVLGEFADDDRTEVCPRCHGYGETP